MTPDEPDAELVAHLDADDLDAAGLRAAFAAVAHDITPGPVPLAEVRRRGLALRRRRAVALAGLAVLAVSGVAAVAGLALPAGPEVTAAPPIPTTVTTNVTTPAPAAPLPPAVRVVRPGERVAGGKGWTVWLTAEGKHWTGPDGYANTRSVTDGNVAISEPGISYQREGGREGVFHSGLYYGTRSVGRVELRDPAAGTTVLATLLELPGRPGWGVWYAYTPPAARDLRDPREVTDPRDLGGLPDVLLYDRAGRRLAELLGNPSRTVSEP